MVGCAYVSLNARGCMARHRCVTGRRLRYWTETAKFDTVSKFVIAEPIELSCPWVRYLRVDPTKCDPPPDVRLECEYH